MKIRNGFISNSSSSSFILFFDKLPETKEELHTILFGKEIRPMDDYNPYKSDINADRWTTMDMAETVFSDLHGEESIITKYSDIWLDLAAQELNDEKVYDKIMDDDLSSNQLKWKRYDDEIKKRKNSLVKDFKKDIKKGRLYYVSYADEDGSYFCIMEHGNIFRNVEHIIISNH